jgi:crossover junction endodeoxyribonuclease RuvC
MPNQEKIILGIDPGTTVMGYGLLRVSGNRAEMLEMGVLMLSKYTDPYTKLEKIWERVDHLCRVYTPDEMAIEAPFFGKNVQSMLKLGRAQGVAIAAARIHDINITEYAPMKIKMALTGNGDASKEQVAGMLIKLLHLIPEQVNPKLDATDALAAAYCHFMQMGRPTTSHQYSSWKDFALKNKDKNH